jgi:hypothetical protein
MAVSLQKGEWHEVRDIHIYMCVCVCVCVCARVCNCNDILTNVHVYYELFILDCGGAKDKNVGKK